MSWQDEAKRLPTGKHKKTSCEECGAERAAIVTNGVSGLRIHCFKCDRTEFEPHGERTLEELRLLHEANDTEQFTKSIQLPDELGPLPKEGLLWLLKAGVNESLMQQYKIGFSKKMQRVVLPVYDGQNLVWWQARAVMKGQKPKYIQPTADLGGTTLCSQGPTTQSCVVTEDCLSAIKTGQLLTSHSILGTSMSTAQAVKIAKHSPVYVWLDGDAAGRRGAHKIAKALGLLTEVYLINTPNDPKYYTKAQIQEILQCSPSH